MSIEEMIFRLRVSVSITCILIFVLIVVVGVLWQRIDELQEQVREMRSKSWTLNGGTDD